MGVSEFSKMTDGQVEEAFDKYLPVQCVARVKLGSPCEYAELHFRASKKDSINRTIEGARRFEADMKKLYDDGWNHRVSLEGVWRDGTLVYDCESQKVE